MILCPCCTLPQTMVPDEPVGWVFKCHRTQRLWCQITGEGFAEVIR